MSATLKKAAGQVANAVDSGGAVHNILCGTDGSLQVTGVAGAPIAVGPGAKPSTATASPARFANFGADATKNVKATPGNVFSLYCYNDNAATRFIQLHNTATVPASNDVPLYSFPVYAGLFTLIGQDFFDAAGVNFSLGIAFAFSTAKEKYTAGTAAEQNCVILFK